MIIAVDFDGVLCENAFPEIGKPNYTVIMEIRKLLDLGEEVILWTSRVGRELEEAVKWCEDYGLHFTTVNEDAPSNVEQYRGVYDSPPRKIYADVYIDDHNMEYILHRNKIDYSLSASINEISRRCIDAKR